MLLMKVFDEKGGKIIEEEVSLYDERIRNGFERNANGHFYRKVNDERCVTDELENEKKKQEESITVDQEGAKVFNIGGSLSYDYIRTRIDWRSMEIIPNGCSLTYCDIDKIVSFPVEIKNIRKFVKIEMLPKLGLIRLWEKDKEKPNADFVIIAKSS